MTVQSKRIVGVVMMIGGLGLFAFGVASLLGAGDDNPAPVALGTTTAPTSTTIVVEITIPPPPTTTTAPAPSTTVEPTTTTTINPAALIEAFVIEFAAATAADDTGFLFESLHPAVFELHDRSVCSAFVEDEIILLDDYRLIGLVEGPETRTFGQMTIEVYTAPIAFNFQGAAFEAQAGFALSEGEVGWLTECE